MRMIAARATLRNEIAVVLEHVQMVLSDDAACFASGPIRDGRNTKIHGHAFERLRLPSAWWTRHHPIAGGWMVCAQGASPLACPCLRPIHPEPEFQAALMCLVSQRGNTSRKLFRVGYPIAHAAKPAGVQMKHLES